MRRLLGWCAVLLLGPVRLAAQGGSWNGGFSIGSVRFAGFTSGSEPGSDTLRIFPAAATLWGASVGYDRGSLRLAISARYGQPGLAVQGPKTSGLLLVAANAYHLGIFTAGVSAHLVRLYGGPSLRSSVALSIERWTGAGSPTRTTLGGQLGLAMEVALARAFVATLEADLGMSPASPFRNEDLPDGFKQRAAWRRGLAGGISWRF